MSNSESDYDPTPEFDPEFDPEYDPEFDPEFDPRCDPKADSGGFEVPDYFPDELPLFMPGMLVRHRRYGYRGIVVDFDMSCHADDQWYNANPSHPDREQPWYHILVHGSTINTYAAQENLIPDATAGLIDHPLIEHFFEDTDKADYLRNGESWPSFDS